jgi:branched-chain amino acid transport system ATP-binding protein
MTTETKRLVEVDGLSAGYGHVPVLSDVTLHVDAGEIVTLVGANGSGKSTLLRAIMGVIRPSGGVVRFDGQDVTRVPPEHMVRRGVALVPEGRMLFGPLSVEDNLRLGAHARGRAQYAESLERVVRLFPMLADRLRQSAATLSGGEQQMLAIARGLMSRPEVLLLDEPSLGLAPKVIAEIFSTLDTLRADGLTVLLVEQDVKVALRHADRGYVMRTGRIVMEDTAAELLANEHIRHIYLGAWDADATPGAAGGREGSEGS